MTFKINMYSIAISVAISVASDVYFQVASTVATLEHPVGTVYARLAPDSYVTAPLLSTLMNL